MAKREKGYGGQGPIEERAARNFVRESNYRAAEAFAMGRDVLRVECAPPIEVPPVLSLRQWLEITETQPDS